MLRATTWTHGRRGAVIGASAAVACLGAVLAGCGSGGGDGYVAVGAAGGTKPAVAAEPTGGVRVVPLDGSDGSDSPGTEGSSETSAPGRSSVSGTPGSPEVEDVPGASDAPSSPASAAEGAKPGRTPTSSPAGPSPTASAAAPAALTVSDPAREATDQRWCEKVTLVLRNSGGSAVRSGTVTFGTHIIGALGIDWGTVESAVALPAPIGAGARKEKAWTVCVDAWRVPLGMHIETRDVSVQWK
ncbi:hypothetical protein OG864_27240 [Streptomyces sp. NBC_00124]|uniref:hypothetical protein n=1 Tax=Streptomyces sp. NBC_00124 TaxID=2975662 RepID=UPI0022582145|nr:hypothetical protein [Streptomyces sp. NBC_00124]MCX5362407.1 hypothetical protein [Streptomyces sp. NBC_00124]